MTLYIAANDEGGVIRPRPEAQPITTATLAESHDLSTLRVLEELTGHFYWHELVEVEDYLYGYPARLLRHKS